MKDKRKKIFGRLALIVVCLLVIVVGSLAYFRLEGRPPEADFTLPGAALGLSQKITVKASDYESGLRRIWVGFLKDGKETTLLERSFPAAGLFQAGTVKAQTISFNFEPHALGFTDGKGMLRLLVEDYSWRNWARGNRYYKELEVLIDTKPPAIGLVSKAHYFAQGGSGLVVYSLNEDCRESGVVVGDRFYRGYQAGMGDKKIYLAFVAVAHDQPRETPVYLEARDYAGNKAKRHFNYRINARRFRKDKIRLSDGFLQAKVPELLGVDLVSKNELLSGFLKINREMRKADNNTIADATSRSEDKILWKGPFLRMPHSASRARFADRRTYIYKGQVVDRQVHMGIDLASVAKSPVPAANNGKIVFCARLGIYGNTVIIDHGMGLFSLYAHLSKIDVEPNQMVEKGTRIGLTGRTGLAGGDHLHFSMLVHGTFVNPIQWWDPQWVQNNITSKLISAQTLQE